MKRRSLTPRPRVPALVRATALGALTFASAACGDDDGSTTTVADSDVAPTAGPCAHNSGGPECETTGQTTMTGSGTGTSTTGGNDADTDIAPTAGPCAHDPNSPGCASSSSSEGSGGESSGTGGSGSSSSGG